MITEHRGADAMMTYTVAITDRGATLYASSDPAVGWVDLRGTTARLTSARKDEVVAEAIAAGVPYDIIEHEGQTAGGRRIGGTAVLITRL